VNLINNFHRIRREFPWRGLVDGMTKTTDRLSNCRVLIRQIDIVRASAPAPARAWRTWRDYVDLCSKLADKITTRPA
jgi:hypothetical protein